MSKGFVKTWLLMPLITSDDSISETCTYEELKYGGMQEVKCRYIHSDKDAFEKRQYYVVCFSLFKTRIPNPDWERVN